MKIYVNYNFYTVHEEHSNEAYGDWSKINDFNIINATSQKPQKGTFEEIDISFNPSEKVFVLIGVYNQGDSFGHEENCMEIIDVFETEEEANEIAKKVELIEKLNQGNIGYNEPPKSKEKKIKEAIYLLGDNVEIRKSWGTHYHLKIGERVYDFPWGGYFERLSEARVIEVDFN